MSSSNSLLGEDQVFSQFHWLELFICLSLPLSYPTHPTTIHSLGVSWLFREHPEHKVSVLLGLKGGGDDDILSLGQAEAGADLSQVDEEL